MDQLDDALALVGDRWTLLIVDALLDGPKRFGELASAVGGIAPNILTQRLRQLESAGLLAATPYSRRPVRLAYCLTEAGESLRSVVAVLRNWATRQAGGTGPTHDACGTALELLPWCPTCERMVDPDHAELHHL
jgi:DNA-binding HxlR family transcriptional regulator